MRRPNVVASAALIVALATVAVPAAVGSRTPSVDLPFDPALLRPVEARVLTGGTAMTTPTLDPAYRSDGSLDTGATFREPAASFEPPQRSTVANPAAPVEFVPIATLTPRPQPRPQPASGGGDTGGATSGGGGGGGWNYDPDVSWYGPGFYGNRTACGHEYTRTILGVAHKTLPCGTRVTFRNPANGAVITVPVIDRGPYVAGRQWDLSAAACIALDHCYTGPLQWRR